MVGQSVEEHIQVEQLRRLCQQLPANFFANILVVLAFAFVYHASAPILLLLAWVGYSQLVNLYGFFLVKQCRQEIALADKTTHYTKRFLIYTLADALTLVSALWLFFVTQNTFHNLFLIMTLLGVTAGGQASLISHRRAAILFTTGILLSLSLRLLFEVEIEYLLLSALTLVFMAVLIRFIFTFNNNLQQTWRLSFDLAKQLDERNRAEVHLRESEEQYRHMVEQSPNAIVVMTKGKLVYANAVAVKLFSANSDNASLESSIELHLESLLEDKAQLDVISPENNRDAYDYTLRRLDGSLIELEVIKKNIRLHGKDAIQLVLRDISDRKKMEKMKDDFISTVSHELRTPLTSIYGAVGIIRGKYNDHLDDKLRPLTEIIYNNSLTLNSLVNDILDISKIEAGELEFHLLDQELEPLLQQAVEDNKTYASQFRVQLESDINLTIHRIYTDETRFKQILNNLISNAVKYSSEDEVVTIVARNNPTTLTLSVCDSGTGIPLEFQKEVFSKFSHIENENRKIIKGTGLGLYLTKSLVERLGGSIGFESQPGDGSTFIVTLPLSS